MPKKTNDDLVFEILSAVSEIPCGKVSTYGQIAKLIGREKNRRLVGKVLSVSRYYGKYPCHRVVNSRGRLCPGWPEQQYLLSAEGVPLKKPGYVDIKKYLWNPDEDFDFTEE